MKYRKARTVLLCFLLLGAYGCHAEQDPRSVCYTAIDLSEFEDGFHHARYQYVNETPPWDLYQPEQILGIAENMLILQNSDGGWPKNLDYQRIYTEEEAAQLALAEPSPSTLGSIKG